MSITATTESDSCDLISKIALGFAQGKDPKVAIHRRRRDSKPRFMKSRFAALN